MTQPAAADLHPAAHATVQPDKPALIMATSGETLSYGELDARSNQVAQMLRRLGLETGDAIALCLENGPAFFDVAWGAQRAGLYFTCLSTKLSVAEAEYIVRDSQAKVVVISAGLADLAAGLAERLPDLVLFMAGGASPPWIDFDIARAGQPSTPIADESAGQDLLYSSGTTGRPKGIRRPLGGGPIGADTPVTGLIRNVFGFSADSIFLSPAPLYHSAPLRYAMSVQRLGGTVVVMEKFDAEDALRLIETHRVTDSQWVPTHFVRMLKLPHGVRSSYDVSSLKTAIHAAAPCPIPVKQEMMAWWGPILFEYYAGTEANGCTLVTPQEWLRRPGTVGRAIQGEIRICDEAGEPVAGGTEGLVYFAGGPAFEYLNDPAKTAESRNRHGWSTLGDIGWVDEEGYLFLTDRKSFMIISGGVNIYPQEVENLLIGHPKVADVAVFGAPDEEMGEKVVAVVQPLDWREAGPDLARELTAFARANLSHVKTPRLIEFMAELPRHATGKLHKRLLRDAYAAKA